MNWLKTTRTENKKPGREKIKVSRHMKRSYASSSAWQISSLLLGWHCNGRILHHNLMKVIETIRISKHKTSMLLAETAICDSLSKLLYVFCMLQIAFMDSLLLPMLSVTLFTVYLSTLCACASLLSFFIWFYVSLCKLLAFFHPIASQERSVFFSFCQAVIMKTNLLLIDWLSLKRAIFLCSIVLFLASEPVL